MNPTELVFVFGSNLAGRHGAGAARFAQAWRGAVAGQGIGPHGMSYAIPTKDASLKTLPLDHIHQSVTDFLVYAEAHLKLKFQVTRIGCGLAGYTDDVVAPLFFDAPDNCYLPGVWESRRRRQVNPNDGLFRVIVAGSRGITSGKEVFHYLEHITENIPRPFTVVSGGAAGVDMLGEKWAAEQGLHVVLMPADWGRYQKAAGPIRNVLMAWHATHLVALWDGKSRGTAHMIDTAKKCGLSVKIKLTTNQESQK